MRADGGSHSDALILPIAFSSTWSDKSLFQRLSIQLILVQRSLLDWQLGLGSINVKIDSARLCLTVTCLPVAPFEAIIGLAVGRKHWQAGGRDEPGEGWSVSSFGADTACEPMGQNSTVRQFASCSKATPSFACISTTFDTQANQTLP